MKKNLVKILLIPKEHRSIFLIVLFATVVRLAFFSATIIWPIPNEAGAPVSPLVQSGSDLHYYKSVAVRLQETDALSIAGRYLQFYQEIRLPDFSAVGVQAALLDLRIQATKLLEYLNVGPAFPILLGLFDFKADNTLPVAIVFLIIGIATSIIWIAWLHGRGMPTIWLVLFAFLPGPLYFSIALSTDLPFMFVTGIFFWSYMDNRQSKANILLWFSAIVLMALLRPTALSILAFVVIDLCLLRKSQISLGARLTMGLSVIGLLAITLAYYLPHGIHVVGGTTQLQYFGVTISEYYSGLFAIFPEWIDKILSVLLLVGAKILYFVGLRPSFGNTETWLVLLRSAPGVVLLPGLAWGLIMTGWRMRLFLLLFLFPILAGPAQDRYSLPIQPILFYYCACAYSHVITRFFPDFLPSSKKGSNIFDTWIELSIVKITSRLKLP